MLLPVISIAVGTILVSFFHLIQGREVKIFYACEKFDRWESRSSLSSSGVFSKLSVKFYFHVLFLMCH